MKVCVAALLAGILCGCLANTSAIYVRSGNVSDNSEEPTSSFRYVPVAGDLNPVSGLQQKWIIVKDGKMEEQWRGIMGTDTERK